jgi:hypothetical protein
MKHSEPTLLEHLKVLLDLRIYCLHFKFRKTACKLINLGEGGDITAMEEW